MAKQGLRPGRAARTLGRATRNGSHFCPRTAAIYVGAVVAGQYGLAIGCSSNTAARTETPARPFEHATAAARPARPHHHRSSHNCLATGPRSGLKGYL